MSMTSASGTLGAISQISECSSDVKGESYVGIGVGVGVGVGAATLETVISRLQESRVPEFPAPSSFTINVHVPAASLFKRIPRFVLLELLEVYVAGPSQRSKPRYMTTIVVPSG